MRHLQVGHTSALGYSTGVINPWSSTILVHYRYVSRETTAMVRYCVPVLSYPLLTVNFCARRVPSSADFVLRLVDRKKSGVRACCHPNAYIFNIIAPTLQLHKSRSSTSTLILNSACGSNVRLEELAHVSVIVCTYILTVS